MKRTDQAKIEHYLRQQCRKRIQNKIIIEYVFYEENKRRDLDNIAGYFHKIFQDALVDAGIIKNDNWAHIVGFRDDFFVDRNNPRIEINLIEVKGR